MKTMTTSGTIADTDTRLSNLLALIMEQVQAKVRDNAQDAEQAAADTADDSDKPPVAKLTLTVSWPAGAAQGKIKCRASYGKPRKDESEAQFDLETSPLPSL